MAFWNSLKEQMLALWSRWTIGQRTGFSAAAVACVAAIAGTMMWAAQPEYVVLLNGLSPQRAAEIAGILETEKISYKLNFPGSAISVASNDVAQARLALKDEIQPDEVVEPAENMFMPGSPADAAARRLRRHETEIRKLVMQLQDVRTAEVKIGQPPETPFAIEQSPVTASVVVETRSGGRLPPQTSQTILNIVANSIAGLKIDNISLSDKIGNQYGNRFGMESDLEMQLAHKRMVEDSIAFTAKKFLERMQGVRAEVQVTAEIDFSKKTETRNTVDPESKVASREKMNSSSHDGIAVQPVGLAGTATNIPPGVAAGAQGATGKSKTEDLELEYELTKTLLTVNNASGKIVRLSVAAVVDVQQPVGADPAAPPAQTLTQQTLEEIVKSAVGYQIERNDEVTVTLQPLAPEQVEEPIVSGFIWEQWQPLVQYTSLGLAALLAFFIGMMLMKRMKPIVITETVGPGIPLADARRLATLSEQAKANPDIVASILSAWLNEQEELPRSPAVAAQGREAYRTAATTTTPKAGAGAGTTESTSASVPRSATAKKKSEDQRAA